MAWHSNTTTCLKLDNKCVLSMSTSLNVINARVILTLWSDCTLHPFIDEGRTHRVASNMAGTSAVTHLLRMLCPQPMKHSSKKWCASLAPERDTHTKCRYARELKQLTATHNRTINFQFVDQRRTVRDMTVCLHRLTKYQAHDNDSNWCE